MKIFTTIALFMLVTVYAFAQNRDDTRTPERNPYNNTFKLSAGLSNTNSGTGFAVQNEYIHAIGRFLSLGATLTVSQAHHGVDNETRFYDEDQNTNTFDQMEHYSLLSIGAMAYITPIIRNYRHNILVGGGINLNHQISSMSSVNTLTSTPVFNLSNDKKTGAGFQLMIGYEYNISERFMLGLTASGIFFEESNTFVMASTGYRF